MVTLANAAPVILGRFVFSASAAQTNSAAFRPAFPRGNMHAAQCGAGETRRPAVGPRASQLGRSYAN